MRKVFGSVRLGPDADGGLLSLSQGSGTVVDYAIDFRTSSRRSSWNEPAQCDTYLRGLADYMRDELVSYDLPASLDGLIELTSRIDRRIQTRRGEQQTRAAGRCSRQQLPVSGRFRLPVSAENSHSYSDSRYEVEPMQVGRTSLTSEERELRRRGNLCLYCGQAGHMVSRCPVKGRAHQ